MEYSDDLSLESSDARNEMLKAKKWQILALVFNIMALLSAIAAFTGMVDFKFFALAFTLMAFALLSRIHMNKFMLNTIQIQNKIIRNFVIHHKFK